MPISSAYKYNKYISHMNAMQSVFLLVYFKKIHIPLHVFGIIVGDFGGKIPYMHTHGIN